MGSTTSGSAKSVEKRRKAAMLMLNNLKVTRNGSSIQAVISMPRQTATDALAKTMDKGPAAAPVPQNEFFLLSQERAGIE